MVDVAVAVAVAVVVVVAAAAVSVVAVFVVSKSEVQPTNGLLPSSDKAAGRASGIVDDDIRLTTDRRLAKGSMSLGLKFRKVSRKLVKQHHSTFSQYLQQAKSASHLPSRKRPSDLPARSPLISETSHC